MQGTISGQHIETRFLNMHTCAHTHTKATCPVWFHIASKFEMQHNLIIEYDERDCGERGKGYKKMERGLVGGML